MMPECGESNNLFFYRALDFPNKWEKISMPKISVIIPVYNVEKYLEKCLLSIMWQTFNDI